jgi:hypothetical protein
MPSAAPAVPDVDLTLTLTTPDGESRTVDLATRAVVVAVVPTPRFGREAEVLAGVAAAGESGADIVEVPAEPKLLGPAAQQSEAPIAALVSSNAAARGAVAAGASLLLVPRAELATVLNGDNEPGEEPQARQGAVRPSVDWSVAVLVDSAAAGRDSVVEAPDRPVAIDVTGLSGADAVSEESLALAVGVRVIRTADVRRTRRVVEVMAHLLAARR